MRGAAMAELPLFDCNGTCSRYRTNPSSQPEDALKILADNSLNTVRLRLFGPDVFPNNSYASLDGGVLAMARRAKAAGLQISLDIFYTQWYFGQDSDYLQRRTPPRWANLSFPELVQTAANWTEAAMLALKGQGTVPTTVQIGNEIGCGLLHNWNGQPCSRGGEICNCKDNWSNLAAIIAAGIKAVKTVNSETSVIIQLGASSQLADGDKWGDLYKFYTSIDQHGANFDAFGLSFYQIWGATNVSNLCTMNHLATALPDKRIYVIETGYPYKPGGHAPQDMKPKPEFGISPQAQEEWLRAVVYTVEHGMWGRGAGVSWWGTEYPHCSHDECAGFWDENYTAMPILTNRAFGPTDAAKPPPGGVICPPLQTEHTVYR